MIENGLIVPRRDKNSKLVPYKEKLETVNDDSRIKYFKVG
jgi:hypothetical protein